MACITYPPAAFTLPHTSQLKYSVTVNVCLDCVDHERCQSRLKVLENDTCIHSIIGHSGLRKLGLDAAGQLVQGDCLRALLRHDDWLRGLSTLVLVDYGYSGEIELTKVHFRDVRMMEARGPKLKLCPLRISQDPHPGKHDWSS